MKTQIHHSLWLGVFLLLLATFARVYLWADAPPGLQHDEIFKALEGEALITHGDLRLFYPSNQGHEGLYVWLLGVSYVLFGKSVLMIKFPALVCGLLTVALMYRVIGEIFNRRVGFLAAGLTTVSLWAVFVNRVGLRANVLPVVALLVVWGVWRILQNRYTWRTVILTGVALGAAIYTYTSAFAVYLAVAAVFAWRRQLRPLIAVAAIGAIVALPMVVIRLTDPQGTNRVSTITRPLNDFLAGDATELIDNFWNLAGMPFFTGDPEWRYNLAGRPLFETPVGLLVYVGLVIALWRMRKQPILAMFLIFATVGLLPSLVTVSAPSFLRSILALPAFMLFIALAVDALPNKKWVWGIGLSIIAITAITDWRAYFDVWVDAPEVHAIYRDDLAMLADDLHHQPAASRVLVSVPDVELDPLIFHYYQPPHADTVSFFNAQTTLALSEIASTRLYISPFSEPTAQHLGWLPAPSALLYRKDGELAFKVYELDDMKPIHETISASRVPVYLYSEPAFPRGGVAKWAEALTYPVNFGDSLALLGVELPRREIANRQDGVNIQLYLQPLVDRSHLPLNIFVHLSRLDGHVHAQRDLLGVPPIQWTRDLVFIQDSFVVAGDTPPGRYILSMGVYNYETGERLPVLDSAGQVVGDRVVIDRIQVISQD